MQFFSRFVITSWFEKLINNYLHLGLIFFKLFSKKSFKINLAARQYGDSPPKQDRLKNKKNIYKN